MTDQAIARWIAENPQPVPLPRYRTTAQWVTWLVAEGFTDNYAFLYLEEPND